MKATGQEQRGSFGIPPEMSKAAAESRKPTEDTPSRGVKISEAPAKIEDPENMTEEQKREKEVELVKKRAEEEIKSIEKEMGIEITANDIFSYVKKGRLAKQVDIVPGALTCVFQTLTGEDLEDIESHMYDYRNKKNATAQGIENEQAITNLAHGLASYNNKSLSDFTKDEARKLLRQLAAHQLNKMVNWNNLFNKIVEHRLNDKDFLKKS